MQQDWLLILLAILMLKDSENAVRIIDVLYLSVPYTGFPSTSVPKGIS